ncbi:PfkB family carbohydrate kinase, partial [Porcipelethomonas sp.]|uniref:PfkB family carbohydrate kinase n=1 Tax=Porcipelethomonas sp. TaxID=2981675 RepID=UPI003EF824C7
PTYTPEMQKKIKDLVSLADLITPNITEACFLTGTDYTGEDISRSKAEEIAMQLENMGCKHIVITGIVKGNSILNMTYEYGKAEFDELHRETQVFSGTGDIFSSVVCALILRGATVAEAVSVAGKFISDAIEYTIKSNTALAEGVVFEPLLHLLGEV